MSYDEMRTTVAEFGSLPTDSSLLVDVPTTADHAQQRLHRLAAVGFSTLAVAVKDGIGVELLSASGWRPHRWISRADYEQVLVAKYGSVAKGRLYLAFDSPHETGLACDFGCGGLMPVSATIEQQKQTLLWKWLVANAWQYGWHPYKVEPWHWEFPMSVQAYKTGVADGAEVVTTCSDVNDVCVESPYDVVS